MSGAWPLWALWIALGIFTVGFLIPGRESNSPVHGWLSLLCDWVPVAVCWVAASRVRFRSVQVSLAATAVTMFALGDTYSVAVTTSGMELPFPSTADIGYLLFYVLMLAALAALVRRQLQGLPTSVLLDSAVGSLGAAAVLAVLLSPILESAIGDTPSIATVVGVAYPLLDLMLVAAAVGVAVAPGLRLGRGWVLLICGLLIFATADVAVALTDAGNDTTSAALASGRALGLAFVATWVDGSMRSSAPAAPGLKGAWALIVPAVAMAAGWGC